jgi:hypothetical protein
MAGSRREQELIQIVWNSESSGGPGVRGIWNPGWVVGVTDSSNVNSRMSGIPLVRTFQMAVSLAGPVLADPLRQWRKKRSSR